ncbi:hypothetical protein M9H77_36267 [Catharanthus roseus]|uniref:Uncharacterized protein n=1 Tax=Catharanthus roseus TaxID=4058 RepID=A0ACB9ZTI3_CATRO|nr:hypothetical protein M9H77_36267 [Catharanthus roseus]
MKLTMFLALKELRIFLNLCKDMARKINPLAVVVEHQTLWQSGPQQIQMCNHQNSFLIHLISSGCQACGFENSWREMVTPYQQHLHIARSSSVNTAVGARKQLRKSKTLTSKARRSAQLKERARWASHFDVSNFPLNIWSFPSHYKNFYQFFFYSPKLILIAVKITALALSYHLYNGVHHFFTDFLGFFFQKVKIEMTPRAAIRMCPQDPLSTFNHLSSLVWNHLHYTLILGLESLPSHLKCSLPTKDRNVRHLSVLEMAVAARGVNDRISYNLGITRKLFRSIGIGGHSTILLGGGLFAR